MSRVPLIVTNDDRYTNVAGYRKAAAGAHIAAILASTDLCKGDSYGSTTTRTTAEDGKRTYELLGKPNPLIFEIIREQHGLDPGSRTLMVGDRPNTDILFGKAAGVDTCLVLSGVVRGKDDFEENWLPDNPAYDPTYIMNMLGDLSTEL